MIPRLGPPKLVWFPGWERPIAYIESKELMWFIIGKEFLGGAK